MDSETFYTIRFPYKPCVNFEQNNWCEDSEIKQNLPNVPMC